MAQAVPGELVDSEVMVAIVALPDSTLPEAMEEQAASVAQAAADLMASTEWTAHFPEKPVETERSEATAASVEQAEPEDSEERDLASRLRGPMEREAMAEPEVLREPAAMVAMEPQAMHRLPMAATAAMGQTLAKPDWAEPEELEPEARPVARRELMDSP